MNYELEATDFYLFVVPTVKLLSLTEIAFVCMCQQKSFCFITKRKQRPLPDKSHVAPASNRNCSVVTRMLIMSTGHSWFSANPIIALHFASSHGRVCVLKGTEQHFYWLQQPKTYVECFMNEYSFI